MNRHIALVEDDDVLRANYTDLLRQAGFAVDAYSTKAEALAGILRQLPDLVLLDITLRPEHDAGFAICTELRRHSESLPIVFLTSHDAEVDKISGLRSGADDYITKDVSLQYLIVRLEALFRRRDALNIPNVAGTGVLSPIATKQPSAPGPDLTFDEVCSYASWRKHRLDLSLTQYWMLRDLYQHLGEPRSHSELMRAANVVVEPNTVTSHINIIRVRFQRIDPSFDQIHTERGRGYRWVSCSPGEATPPPLR
jgi:two-component system, OmpR family, response regulator